MRITFFKKIETVVVDAAFVVYSLYDRSKDKEDQNQELLVLAEIRPGLSLISISEERLATFNSERCYGCCSQ